MGTALARIVNKTLPTQRRGIKLRHNTQKMSCYAASREGSIRRRGKGSPVGILLVICVGVALVLAPVGTLAAPPVPSMAPGFPLLAGPMVMIMWLPVPGAANYNIYLDGKHAGTRRRAARREGRPPRCR